MTSTKYYVGLASMTWPDCGNIGVCVIDSSSGPLWNAPVRFGQYGLPSECVDWKVYQVVSDGIPSDTSVQIIGVGCPCLMDPYFGFTILHLGSGTFYVEAIRRDQYQIIDMVSNPGFSHDTLTFSEPGVYNVCADWWGGPVHCAGLYCDNLTFGCSGPTVANFDTTFNGNQVLFTDVTGAWSHATYDWDFGDGATSNQQNPSHSYNANGTYSVCLKVVDSCGTDSICKVITSNCATTADFLPFHQRTHCQFQ